MTPEDLENGMQYPRDSVDGNILNRIQGSIVGMALGDALGAHVEFRPRQFLVENPVEDLQGGGTWGLQKGQFTDDTSMALCLASSLVSRRDFVPYDQLVRYKWWYRNGYMSSTGHCFDIGAATSQSLRKFERCQEEFAKKYQIPLEQLDFLSDPRLLEKFNVYCSADGVAGNGALMRLTPVPLFFYNYPEYAVEFSGQSGQITHGDRKAYDACRYYGALIVAALGRAKKDELLDDEFYSKHESWFNGNPLTLEIMDIARGSYKQKGGYDDGIRGKGYIVSALEAALWAFWSDEGSFETGALLAVNLGDDADTTAAIYGQLAGAYYGYKKLPNKWLEHVYANDFMTCLSKWIAYEGQRWQPENSSTSQKLDWNMKQVEMQTSTSFFEQSPCTTSDTQEKSCHAQAYLSNPTGFVGTSPGKSTETKSLGESSGTNATSEPKSKPVAGKTFDTKSNIKDQAQQSWPNAGHHGGFKPESAAGDGKSNSALPKKS